MASAHHWYLVEHPVDCCNAVDLVLDRKSHVQMHHVHRRLHCHQVLAESERPELNLHDHTQKDLREHYHGHEVKKLQSHLQLEMQYAHMEQQGTFRSLDMVGDHLWRRMVHQDSCRHIPVGIGSKQHSTGFGSKDDRMGSYQLVVVADGLVEVERLGRQLVVGFAQPGLEWCGHCFDPLRQLHSETEWFVQRSGGIARSSRLVDHCILGSRVAERRVHLGLGILAVGRTVADSSYCTHCAAVGDRQCSTKRTR